jgi:hypothetical protein
VSTQQRLGFGLGIRDQRTCCTRELR